MSNFILFFVYIHCYFGFPIKHNLAYNVDLIWITLWKLFGFKESNVISTDPFILLATRLAVLYYHVQIWLNNCTENHKPVYYRRYVDDIFRSPDRLEKLTNYLNSKHRNINFTYEKDSNNSLPFLDILISRSKNGFKRSVYHKPTFSGVYGNSNSFIYDQYKIGLSFILLFRTFSIVSDFSRFHTRALEKGRAGGRLQFIYKTWYKWQKVDSFFELVVLAVNWATRVTNNKKNE